MRVLEPELLLELIHRLGEQHQRSTQPLDLLIAKTTGFHAAQRLAFHELTYQLEAASHAGAHSHGHGHDHSHGLIDPSIKRSREGLRIVLISLALLGVTAAIQAAIYIATGSIALLADLIHNFGDALTALPLGVAFLLRSERAERGAGLAVVLTILASAITAGVFAILRIIHPLAPSSLLALGLAGAVGIAGNAVAARVRLDGGRRLHSPALVADGLHARSDAIVSAGVVLSSLVVALGAPIADPIIGLAITLMILHITWESWHTVREHGHDSDQPPADQPTPSGQAPGPLRPKSGTREPKATSAHSDVR